MVNVASAFVERRSRGRVILGFMNMLVSMKGELFPQIDWCASESILHPSCWPAEHRFLPEVHPDLTVVTLRIARSSSDRIPEVI